jgi:hypothetical protein
MRGVRQWQDRTQENPRLFAPTDGFVCPQTKRQNDREPAAYPPAAYGDVAMAVDDFRRSDRSVRLQQVWSGRPSIQATGAVLGAKGQHP